MNKKLLLKVLSGSSDANIRYAELCSLLEDLGFEVRTKGSHRIFRKEGIIDKINLQQAGSKAKPYQVKQVRNVIIKHKLGGELNV